MSQAVTLYTSVRESPSPDRLIAAAKGAKSLIEYAENGSWSQLDLKWDGVELALFPSDATTDPEFLEHLDGFAGYTFTKLARGEMNQHTYRMIQKILSIKNCLGITVNPALDKKGTCEDFIQEIANVTRSIIFHDGMIYDSNFKLLFGMDGEHDEEATFEESEDGLERKKRTEEFLKSKNVPTLESLPPLPGTEEVVLRDKQEIINRCKVMAVLAARAEPDGLSRDETIDLLQNWQVRDCLSPMETEFLEKEPMEETDRPLYTWRHESVATLLWALELLPDLKFPVDICDVSQNVSIIKSLREKPADSLSLRPVNEVLDQADLSYRCHWATVDARVKGEESPAELEEGVVYERHFAFNWLLKVRNEDWDDVSTDT